MTLPPPTQVSFVREFVVGIGRLSAVAVGPTHEVVGEVVVIGCLFVERVGLNVQPIAGVIGEGGEIIDGICDGDQVIVGVVGELGAAAVGIDGFDQAVAGIVSILRRMAERIGHAANVSDMVVGHGGRLVTGSIVFINRSSTSY